MGGTRAFGDAPSVRVEPWCGLEESDVVHDLVLPLSRNLQRFVANSIRAEQFLIATASKSALEQAML